MSGKPLDITGQKFHMLTAVELVSMKVSKDNRTEANWLWRCDCGTEFECLAKFVKYNTKSQKKSCGCWYPVKKNFGKKAKANHVYMRNYADGDLTLEQFIELSQQPCFYCTNEPSNKAKHKSGNEEYTFTYNGLDRLDNSLPHNHDNVVPACWRCNEIKSNMNFSEFMNWISKVYHTRLNGQ